MMLAAGLNPKPHDQYTHFTNESSNPANLKADEIGKFYVVMMPTEESTLEDIMFEDTLFSFATRVVGGLDVDQIHGVYKQAFKAKVEARNLLVSVGAV